MYDYESGHAVLSGKYNGHVDLGRSWDVSIIMAAYGVLSPMVKVGMVLLIVGLLHVDLSLGLDPECGTITGWYSQYRGLAMRSCRERS